MRLSGFKKIKHGQLPGDLPKREKITMREARYQHKLAKGFTRILRSRSRAVLKRRTLYEIQETL